MGIREHEVFLAPGEWAKVTVLRDGWQKNARNIVPPGQTWWARHKIDDIIEWVQGDCNLALGRNDSYEIVKDEDVPAEIWAIVARRALIGEDEDSETA